MKKILIVEDDSMLGEIYERKFTQAGYAVTIAASGIEGEKMAKMTDPDLVLLDLVLPEEDGFDILKRIKEDPSTNKIKVVIFSNLSQDEDKQKAAALGANGFIAKSDYTPQQVVDEVNRILNNEESDAAKELSKNMNFYHYDLSKNDKKDILIVEDEEVFLEVFGKKLEDSGFNVETANNGAWGQKLSEERKYDLIILDILMPETNGLELIQAIRKADSLNNETPIIVMSNSVDEELISQIMAAGATEFLLKTRVIPSDLVEKVNELIK